MTPDERQDKPVVNVLTGEPRPPRSRRWFLWLFSIAMVVTAGTAFVFKLVEFIYTATNEGPNSLASFLIPVLNYLLVAAGFLCLFLWSYFTGQFHDVEAPKYRMLRMQGQIERRGQPAKKV
jgi:nitrogen fixation-related uncharacterized protein